MLRIFQKFELYKPFNLVFFVLCGFATINFLDFGPYTAFTVSSLVFSFFLIRFFLVSLWGWPEFFKGLSRHNRFFYIAAGGFAVLALAFHWPGIPEDDFWRLVYYRSGDMMPWVSPVYAFGTQAMLYITGFALSNTVLNLYLFFLLISLIFSISDWRLSSKTSWLLLFFLISPPSIFFLLLHHERDAVFALLLLIVVFGAIKKRIRPNESFQLTTWQLITLCVLCINIRPEGAALIPFAAILIASTESTDFSHLLRQSAKHSAVILFSMGLIHFSSIYFYKALPLTPQYQITAMVNPLSYILHERGLQSLSPDQLEKLEQVFDTEKLVKDHHPYNINPYHNGGLKSGSTPIQFQEFRKTVFEIFIQNSDLFLQNRLMMSSKMLNLNRHGHINEDNLRAEFARELQDELAYYNVFMKNPELNWFEAKYKVISDFFFRNPSPIWHHVIGTGFLPLAFLVFITFFIKQRLTVAIAAILLLFRTLLVCLLSPGGYIKFINTTWIAGWLLLLLLINLYFESKVSGSVCEKRKLAP